jgi:hypothetical protein
MKRQIMGREVVVAITSSKHDFGPWEQILCGEFDGGRRKRVLIKIIGEQQSTNPRLCFLERLVWTGHPLQPVLSLGPTSAQIPARHRGAQSPLEPKSSRAVHIVNSSAPYWPEPLRSLGKAANHLRLLNFPTRS